MSPLTEELTIIDELRARLQPRGTEPLVRLHMKPAAFFKVDFVTSVIDELEQKAKMQAMGLDTMSKMDILVLHVLTDSAEL